MRLRKYCGKRIKITAIDGQVFIGRADLYTSALDSPDGVETLSIRPDSGKEY